MVFSYDNVLLHTVTTLFHYLFEILHFFIVFGMQIVAFSVMTI